MGPVVLALTGQVWRRHRLGLAICGAVWLAMVAVALIVPPSQWQAGSQDGPVLPAHFIFLIGSCIPVMAFVICSFAYNGDVPLEAMESAFPRWTFVLPARTWTLVGWPMLQAVGVTVGAWIGWNVTVFRPAGLDLPAVWPGLLLAAVVAWLQAVCWTPHPLPFLRIVTLILVVGLVGLVALFAPDLSPLAKAALFAPLLPAAYGVALLGVAKARHGDLPEWRWPVGAWRAILAALPRRGVPISSPLAAQTWFEWRMRGIGFPLVVGLCVLVWWQIALLAEKSLSDPTLREISPAFAAFVAAMSAPGYLLAVLLAMPLLFAGVFGTEVGGVRRVDGKPVDPSGCHPFVALRPLTDGELFLAKLRMAVRTTLIAWVLPVVSAVAWLSTGGRWQALTAAPVFQPYGGLQIGVGLAAVIVGLVLLTWLRLVGGMWVSLTGRVWLINTIGIVGSVAWMPFVFAGIWLYRHPDAAARLVAALPTVAAIVIGLKLVLAAWLAPKLCRRCSVPPRVLVLAAAGWAAVAAGFVGLLAQLFPREQFPLYGVAAVVVLLMPLSCLIAAPLILAWNRHR